MDPFLANAEHILAAAESCARAEQHPGDWTILVGPRGQIEMVAGSEWALDTLRGERGAVMAFRVGERRGRIAVEGRTPSRSCRLEAETPAATARRLLGCAPSYTLAVPALAAPAESPAT